MKNLFSVTVFIFALTVSAFSMATAERVKHFKGLPAPDLNTAVTNFVEYNKRLEEKLNAELTDEVVLEIHQLTYTLENALKKINQELDVLANTLEEVHIASENSDRVSLQTRGQVYLEVSRTLVK